jgi:hypothetical protein
VPERERNEILPEDIDGLDELDDDDIEALVEWFPHLSLQPELRQESPLTSPIESSDALLNIDDHPIQDASPMRLPTPTASPPQPASITPPSSSSSPPPQPTLSTTTSPTSPISPTLLSVQPRPLVRIVPAQLKPSNKENIPENIAAQIASTPVVATCEPATPPVQQPTPPPAPSAPSATPSQQSPRRKAKAAQPKQAFPPVKQAIPPVKQAIPPVKQAIPPVRRVLGDITKAINNQAASRKRRAPPQQVTAAAQPRKRSPTKNNAPKSKETVESTPTPRKRSPPKRQPVTSPEKVSPTKRRVTFSEHNITHTIPSRFDDDDSSKSTWAAATPARPVKVVQVPSSISPDDVKRTLRKRTLAEKESMWRVEMASMQQALREIDEETLLVELV